MCEVSLANYDPVVAPSTERATTRLVDELARHGERTAIVSGTDEVSYRRLAALVHDAAARFGTERRLVLIAGRNDIEAVVAYLGALAARQPVLLVPGDPQYDATSLVDTYDPDIVIEQRSGSWHFDERRSVSRHTLHPDLALLLSTSGSTGSPKLVRLSRANLRSNAESIATYLDIRHTDRAMTSLPMNYCYGLSVLHSHLLRGAGIVLTDASVVDAEFWDLFGRHRATTFAGVPYTFDLLDKIGFEHMHLPHLRYLTQAGGRLAPDRVARYAALGERDGWDLFVMYGATEATARMAYLPPHLARSHPNAIGVAIPGGSFRIDRSGDEIDPDAGELVYSGPNVMMGYAESAADLAAGATVDELRTGDIAKRGADGLYEILGRSARFVKLFGLRIDLPRVEAALDTAGITASCIDGDDELVVAFEGALAPAKVRAIAAAASGLPAAAVRACRVAELPRLHSGKPDYPEIRTLGRAEATSTARTGSELRELFAQVLRLDVADIGPQSTFVELGGDSLSYVAMSVRLERKLGHLPPDWHTTPIRDLRVRGPRRWIAGRSVETSVMLRAVAIVLVVGSHAGLYHLWGGAHILLGVAGYNFARFVLTDKPRTQRLRHLLTTVAGIAIPAVAWIALTLSFSDDYTVTNLFLLNKILGPDGPTQGHLWFIEVLVYFLLALAALLAIPVIDRLERRQPFVFALALLAVGLAIRYDAAGLEPGSEGKYSWYAFWFFALGWAAAKARTRRHQLVVAVALVVSIHGYFDSLLREGLVVAGLMLLIWAPTVRIPSFATPVASVLASSSLYIYLTHWQIYPLFASHPVIAVAAALLFGIGFYLLADKAKSVAERYS